MTLTAWSLAKTLLFIAAVVFVARLIRYSSGRITVSKQLLGHLLVWLKGKEALFAIVLLFVLLFATLSDLIGLYFIIGAFFGAMILGHESIGLANYEAVKKIASTITMEFLGPIFFAGLGLEFQMASLGTGHLSRPFWRLHLQENSWVDFWADGSQACPNWKVGHWVVASTAEGSWNS